MKKTSLVALLLTVLFVAGGCRTASLNYQRLDNPALTRISVGATLGPGDVFEVRVYREPDLSGSFRVPPSGVIEFPLIGAVKVDGLTPTSVEEEIRERLKSGFLKSPWVTVFVKQYNSKKITVIGQVQRPGTYPFESEMHIIQAISVAGGFTNTARRNYIIVTRRKNRAERRIPVPVELISRGLAKNFFLQPGDIIFVPESPI